MKIVIDISDEEYKTLSKMSEKEKVNELSYYERIIANGIPYEETTQDNLIHSLGELCNKYCKNCPGNGEADDCTGCHIIHIRKIMNGRE